MTRFQARQDTDQGNHEDEVIGSPFDSLQANSYGPQNDGYTRNYREDDVQTNDSG